jgi:protein TonB
VGTVVLDVDVTPSGTVAAIRIARTAGKKAFDRAAITAVKKWRFAPATQAGRPVADTRRFSFRFEPPARR